MTNTYNPHRTDIVQLKKYGLEFENTWQVVDYFERTVAKFFNAPYAVATDCCTHALELSLRLLNYKQAITLPNHTYMSVPMMLDKLEIPYNFNDLKWQEFYELLPGKLIDAATFWRPGQYQPSTLTCISFQFKKHLPIGRGGMILLDNFEQYQRLQRMTRDGRDPTLAQANDNVTEIGYHYYMTPEDAARGIELYMNLHDQHYTPWGWQDYRNLLEMDYFKRKLNA